MPDPLTVRDSIAIEAPIAVAWRVVVGFSNYEEWNPFVVSVLAPPTPRVGSRLDLKVRFPDGSRSAAVDVITGWSPPEGNAATLVYEYGGWLPRLGLLRVRREQRLVGQGSQRCCYTSIEEFGGPMRRLVPLSKLESGTRAQTIALGAEARRLAEASAAHPS